MPTATLTTTAQLDPVSLELLEREVAQALLLDAEIWKFYNQCNLDPTHRACLLAARAAVAVLIAHNFGQGVGK